MKLKPILALMLVLCLLATLAGCADSGTAVYVQSVRTLTGFGGIAPGDRFPGMVVSENVTKIEKDSDKTVAELLVSVGDDVEEGQALFSYDTEELQLNLDKQKLELEQLEATIVNYTQQIADLEEDREYAWGSDELQYTIQIQTLQVQLKETGHHRRAAAGRDHGGHPDENSLPDHRPGLVRHSCPHRLRKCQPGQLL